MDNFEWLVDARRYWANNGFWDATPCKNEVTRKEIIIGISTCLHQELKWSAVFVDDLERRLNHLPKSIEMEIDYNILREAEHSFINSRRTRIEEKSEGYISENPLLTAYSKIISLFSPGSPDIVMKIGSMIAMEDLPYKRLQFFLKHHLELQQNQENRIGTAFDTRRYILRTYPENPLEGESEMFAQYFAVAREHRGHQNLARRLSLQGEITKNWYETYKGELTQ